MFFFPLLLIGLLGAVAMAGESVPKLPPLTPRRKTVTMGDSEDDSTQQKSKDLERFLVRTMRLTDPQEVARRARRLAREYPGTAKLVMRRARELELAKDAAKAPEAVYRASKFVGPASVFNLKWTCWVFLLFVDTAGGSQAGYQPSQGRP